ncbi:putative mitochondrial intermembrane space translocase subunit Tim9 [Aspergillus flavus]|uniref:Mitochondrial import inner membrane translocase subunit n=1 Tax=Aspergillus flavus (strain ATCC 200026 / FGSC A1120 / IAM 13836 / NRRL 3357 / JCM 12722 / SRRC 167) TaxID=332952 RepID=A0A7U2QTM4_ASPFN|nr:putative mitochondrial intermembrane space translocase subunit Tim9 [Aspergillus flavus]RAQ61575.1 mitochondrial intermembrane space translocase subunit Tim9 [Aspergillus flavus]
MRSCETRACGLVQSSEASTAQKNKRRLLFLITPPNPPSSALFKTYTSNIIMEGLNASEQREFAARMERKQLKEFMTMYSKLVQRCFDDCVNDFTTKSLISREEGCTLRCVDKFLKGSQRLNERFQEQNAAMMQSGQMPGR